MEHSKEDRRWTWLATMGPIGHLPIAPGTWGSLVATLLAPFIFLPLPLVLKPAVIMVILAVGVRACTRAETVLGQKDPGCVVWDELFGQWVALLPLTPNAPWWLFAAGFFLFRFFDIVKPWPVRQMETKYEAGLGVMLDDGAAGIYAFLCLWLLINLV